MKKNYKVKEKNKTKLKAYLKDGTKTTSKRGGRCTDIKYDNIKRSDFLKHWGSFKDYTFSYIYCVYRR